MDIDVKNEDMFTQNNAFISILCEGCEHIFIFENPTFRQVQK